MPTTDTAEIARYLSRTGLFRDLNADELAAIAGMCHVAVYPKGPKIFDEHDLSDDLFLIYSGIVAVHVVSIVPSYDITIAKLREGEVLGEFSLVNNSDRSAAATCLEEVTAFVLPIPTLLAHFEVHPAVGYRVMRNAGHIMAGRVKKMNRRLLNVTRAQLF